MEKIEKQLRDQLQEYIEDGECLYTSIGDKVFDEELRENTKSVRYVYEKLPLWNGGMNCNLCYETIHYLSPKLPSGIDLGTSFSNRLDNKVRAIAQPILYLFYREVIERERLKEIREERKKNGKIRIRTRLHR